MDHATLHFSPETVAAPAQMNPRRSLSKDSIAHEERQRAIDVWTGIVESVLRTNVVLPAMFNKLPFQSGSLAATASMSGCSCHRRSLKMDKGIPK